MMWTSTFWKAALERAVKSGAQALVMFWGIGDGVLNAWSLDWKEAAGAALGMFILSLLTSLASYKVGAAGPSLTKAEKLQGE